VNREVQGNVQECGEMYQGVKLPASEASSVFRNFTRLAAFSGRLSVCDVYIWMGLSNFE